MQNPGGYTNPPVRVSSWATFFYHVPRFRNLYFENVQAERLIRVLYIFTVPAAVNFGRLSTQPLGG